MTSRRDKAIALRKANPCLTTAAIGRKVGLSKQRVWQILSAAGLPTKAWRQKYACWRCGAGLKKPVKRGLCPRCFEESRRLEAICDVCGRHFLREVSVVRRAAKKGYEHFFCSRQCLGRFVGETFGLNTSSTNRPPRKHDYELVYALRDLVGWKGSTIAKALGIPERTVYNILQRRVANGVLGLSTESSSGTGLGDRFPGE